MVGVENGSSKYDEVELLYIYFNMNNTQRHSPFYTQYSIFIMQ